MSDTFKCEYCQKVFEFIRDGSWSEEQARAESKDLFGELPQEDMAIVCDDCFNELSAKHMSSASVAAEGDESA